MKIFSILLALLLTSTPLLASELPKEIRYIVPTGPGSISDTGARALADVFKERTGSNLVIENITGGNMIPAVMSFKNRTGPVVIQSTTSIHVFNPILVKDLPYTDKDFVFVTQFSVTPTIWITRADTQYRTMKDMVTSLPNSQRAFVGYGNPSEHINIVLLQKQFGWSDKSVTPVPYKSGPEAFVGLMAGNVDIVVAALNPTILSYLQEGKIRILGVASDKDLTIAGVNVPSIQREIKASQFNGSSFVSLNHHWDSATASRLKSELIAAINDPRLAKKLESVNQIIVGRGPDEMTKTLAQMRDQANQASK